MLDHKKPNAYQIRDDEPDYARLPETDAPVTNIYGKKIDLAADHALLAGKSLNINNSPAISENPNRYKQHGFYFNADNCISCHACESACSEKNDLPAYLSYRAVGYVEGGSFPSYTRLNISMACNHCDDPVCLKGCPTRAYTKFAEYGAVLQDPDICFGCGYCTWVCPYNAPQLDTERGHVHKCNMCVDRLEVGLKPACASACLAGALDFGIIETTPENREQTQTTIPGFPTPEITHPNIRFQQTRSLPKEMSRTDSVELKYRKDDDSGQYIPEIDMERADKTKRWNLKKLLTSPENAHIAFTLSAQTVMGAFAMMFSGVLFQSSSVVSFATSAHLPVMLAMISIMGFGLLKLNLHLGRPHRFYRGFNNLKLSPVSREIAGVSVFFMGLLGYGFFGLFENEATRTLARLSAVIAITGGIAGFYYMYKLYRIPARPFWNHWQTATAFTGSALNLGALLIAFTAIFVTGKETGSSLISVMMIFVLVGSLIQGIGLFAHARSLKYARNEGAVSHFHQTTKFGKSYLLRNILIGLNMGFAVYIYLSGITGYDGSLVLGMLMLSLMASEIIGRALFYVLVIPTTMPGAFFWRNKGFEEHARETGLAAMPQTGVLPDKH